MRNLLFATGLGLFCAACDYTQPSYGYPPYAYQDAYAYQDPYPGFYDPWLWGPPLGLGAGGFVFLDRQHHVHHHDEDAPIDPHHPSFNRHQDFQQPTGPRPAAPHQMAGQLAPRTPMGQRPTAPHPGGPAPWITQRNRNGG